MTQESAPSSGGTSPPHAALIVAHPGHELRVYHWMETHQPLYFCMTDGSGREGQSRMDSTSRLLKRAGATPGSIYGRFTDREIYQFLLEGRHEVFTGLFEELTGALIAQDISVVAGDSPEGMNPTHDLCRHLIDSAVAAVERITGRHIPNYEFVLDAPLKDCTPELYPAAVWLPLDEAALERKLDAARDYTELKGEIEEGLKYYGKKAFAVECLIPSTASASLEKFEHEAPPYERYGREGVMRHGKTFGKYEDVITFHQHVKPVVQAIAAASRDYVSKHPG
ncbi:MAG TPA: hypothetical protein VLE43_06290 [Candidatus Saccharimonadia bacterium]|nr:hypothetical protein [Candidatus Saccharimonadia bacterium]